MVLGLHVSIILHKKKREKRCGVNVEKRVWMSSDEHGGIDWVVALW